MTGLATPEPAAALLMPPFDRPLAGDAGDLCSMMARISENRHCAHWKVCGRRVSSLPGAKRAMALSFPVFWADYRL